MGLLYLHNFPPLGYCQIRCFALCLAGVERAIHGPVHPACATKEGTVRAFKRQSRVGSLYHLTLAASRVHSAHPEVAKRDD